LSELDLDVEAAYDFYRKYILLVQDKAEVYEKYGFSIQRAVGSKDWEVFAAILLRGKAKGGVGADLQKYEIKSAVDGSSYEYQYHKNTGLEKLEEDKQVDHVFIARSRDYQDIEVWLVERVFMQPKFEKWQPELIENYKNDLRQRFRRSITHNFVKEHGTQIMQIAQGELTNFLTQIPLPHIFADLQDANASPDTDAQTFNSNRKS